MGRKKSQTKKERGPGKKEMAKKKVKNSLEKKGIKKISYRVATIPCFSTVL
jgi:hypothetical protein